MAHPVYPWKKLQKKNRFSHYDEFAELGKYVHAYFNGGPMFENVYEEINGLRYNLEPIVRCGYFTARVIGINLNVSSRTVERFLGGGYPAFRTFSDMMAALADQYEIKDNRNREHRDIREVLHDVEVKFEGEVKTAQSEAQDALDNLLDALDGLIPASQHSAASNRQPVELTPEQYALLVATVRSAQAFSELETWDQRAIRVIRALNDILLELDKLLDTATSIFGKQLKAAIRLVTKPLRTLLDALDGGGGRQ